MGGLFVLACLAGGWWGYYEDRRSKP